MQTQPLCGDCNEKEIVDVTVGAMVERLTVALCVAGSIPARNKYLYGLNVVVPGLAVCECDFCYVFESIHNMEIIPSKDKPVEEETVTQKGVG